MTKPIKPSEVTLAKAEQIPDQVFEAFNELIASGYSNDQSIVKQDKVVNRILEKMPGTPRGAIFENGWLDIEAVYREAGWKVEYDKPAYNENYVAKFVFTPRSARSE